MPIINFVSVLIQGFFQVKVECNSDSGCVCTTRARSKDDTTTAPSPANNMSLSEANIFHLRQLLKDFHTKKSAFIDNHRNCVQILCLVGEENEIFVRFRYYGEHNISKLLNKRYGDDDDPPLATDAQASSVQYNRDSIATFSNSAEWKMIVWFKTAQRTIQDICFDPSGRHLLVVCYDNTLHIVPLLWIINPEFGLKTTTSQEIENFYWPFRSDEITSFIIPFSGPHECSNPKTCPNNTNTKSYYKSNDDVDVTATEFNAVGHDKYSPERINEAVLSNNVYQSFYLPASELKRISGSSYTDPAMQSSGEHNSEAMSIAEKSPDGCEKCAFDMVADNVTDADNNVDGSSENETKTKTTTPNVCPFPMSVVWWSTSRLDEQNHQHRAIVGYSDGSICVLGLAPNCPFIANTSIENKCGGILQMTICRDTIVKSVSLLITTTSKEQWKLLLEQAAIGYVYPDEIQKSQPDSQSQSNAQPSDNNSNTKSKSPEHDWQFVIPVSTSIDKCADERDENGDFFEIDASKECVEHFNGDVEVLNECASGAAAEVVQTTSGIIPAARARLASLRDLGAKKIGALKLKLIENKIKSNDRDRSRQNVTQLITMHMPSLQPEILTTKVGPFFIAQYLRDTHLLSALHSYSDTLSVHSMDISLIPLYLYKIPKDCTNVLLTPNIMYTTQKVRHGIALGVDNKTTGQDSHTKTKPSAIDEYENKEVPSPIKETPVVNAIGVIGCNSTVLRIGEDSEFKSSSMLGFFPFPDEKIINIHRVSTSPLSTSAPVIEVTSSESTNRVTVPLGTTNIAERPMIQQPRVSTQNYAETFSKDRSQHNKDDGNIDDPNFFDLDDKSVLEHTFPTIELDQCLVVTDRSLYMIELNDVPHIAFLNLVKTSNWKACEEFCKVFNLDFNQCTEYAGDVLLRKNKVTHALLTYNVSRIPAVKTALKLAMFGQNSALMHLCAMALKINNILKSVHAKSHTIHYVSNVLLATQQQQQQRQQQQSTSGCSPNSQKKVTDELNSGVACSDFSYEKDETPSDLQMSNSSQFHLSNLLLLTLTEKTIKDKQLMPLWNFLVVNKRYHTNMSSIVLAQSGLYSSTIVLALNRGAHMDAFCSLVGVTNQEFGWYSEINEILYQLSDPIFMECIIYLQSISMDYFDCIQSKCGKIDRPVLERLRHQLDPFTAIFRPVVSQLSSNFIESDANDLNKKWIEFCKHLIETFLMVIIRLYTLKCGKDETTNGLNTICVRHEQNQFAIKVENGLNISAGFAHCAAIIDGSCYLWGSNGVNCALNAAPNSVADSASETSPRCLEFISNMGLEVHAVKCGKTHTLILTNNGLYSMGLNTMGQLGIGKHHVQALQPMLIREFDGKNITLIEVGQYHNAVYADDELFTFGWGIWGQLGHGDIFTLDRPKRVRFFSGKPIKQIALGHAHTLVLCSSSISGAQNPCQMTLYVFGCNLFGALGTGQYQRGSTTQKCLKSVIPIKFEIYNETIVQIHTKFFTNFVITRSNNCTSNKLYTWGASPQLIRLLNQSRKRARMAQKCDETKSTDGGDKKSTDLPNGDVPTTKDASHTNEIENQQKPISMDANGSVSNMENVEACNTGGSPKSFQSKLTAANLQDKIKNFLRSETKQSSDRSGESEASTKINSEFYLDDEYTDHFLPQQVDTGDVVGQIVQVSSGLYHNVLLTQNSLLYVWGRNLEKQLGRENSRCDLTKPTLLELNENVICIDCGADFTLILTDHLKVKAFGNNNVGQCGREMNIPDRNGYSGKLVRLRVSKRIVRLPDSSQCVEQPIEISLPRPKIRMNFDAVRYLKSMPKYRPEFISREIFRSPNFADASPLSENYEYNSLSSDGEQNVPKQSFTSGTVHHPKSMPQPDHKRNACDSDVNSEFIHYCLFILHGIYDAHKILNFTTMTEFKVRILMLNYYVKEAFSLCLAAAKDTIAMHQSQDDVDLDNIMLTSYVIKLFEYFTKDANIVPIHRTDLKYLIQGIFMYFIENSLSLEQLEQYFLNNIDHYLFGLAYVLFFNNNNTKLERQLHKKYSHLFGDCTSDDGLAKNLGSDVNSTDGGSSSLNTGEFGEENDGPNNSDTSSKTDQNDNNVKENYDILFDHVSVTFKAIICQRLIKFDKELN